MEAQEWEADWWGDCTNTFGEEAKQITYAHRMGLVNEPRDGRWPVYDMAGASVLDLGGGPVSMLLKCVNLGKATVVDPCPYPEWVADRYGIARIRVWRMNAEDYRGTGGQAYDEAWIYNVLQHVINPEQVIAAAHANAKLLRIFEWLETEPNVGHPHTLHADELNRWIGGSGDAGMVDENGAVGLAYWGAFDLGQ